MATYQLKALVNTTIKQSTIDSSKITDPSQKFSLISGSKLAINHYKSAPNNHWELELTSPINGVKKWFAYIPHVILSSPSQYTVNSYPELDLNGYQTLEHAVETSVDLGLNEENGRKLFEEGILPILQSVNTFETATAKGQQELDQRGNVYGIKDAPCAYSVSCVMKYIAEKLGINQVKKLFDNTFEIDCIQVTGVEKKLRRLGFLYFLKKDYLAPRGAIGARSPRYECQGTKNGSGHIYFITKDGAERTQFPNPTNENDPPEQGISGPAWKIKDLHAENLHFFDHVYMQWEDGYTDGFWLPPGIYPFKR